jgi:hypothetical protein
MVNVQSNLDVNCANFANDDSSNNDDNEQDNDSGREVDNEATTDQRGGLGLPPIYTESGERIPEPQELDNQNSGHDEGSNSNSNTDSNHNDQQSEE